MTLAERLHYAAIGAATLTAEDAAGLVPLDEHEAALERAECDGLETAGGLRKVLGMLADAVDGYLDSERTQADEKRLQTVLDNSRDSI